MNWSAESHAAGNLGTDFHISLATGPHFASDERWMSNMVETAKQVAHGLHIQLPRTNLKLSHQFHLRVQIPSSLKNETNKQTKQGNKLPEELAGQRVLRVFHSGGLSPVTQGSSPIGCSSSLVGSTPMCLHGFYNNLNFKNSFEPWDPAIHWLWTRQKWNQGLSQIFVHRCSKWYCSHPQKEETTLISVSGWTNKCLIHMHPYM